MPKVSGPIRTSQTLEGILRVNPHHEVPTTITPALNERDYGIYTGKNKWQVQQEIGDQAFEELRRGWNCPVPEGETIKAVYSRSVPFYIHTIVPLLDHGETILIIAHGNSIRTLMKYIESISDQAITKTEMIFGTALIYTVDQDGRELTKEVRQIDSPPPPA